MCVLHFTCYFQNPQANGRDYGCSVCLDLGEERLPEIKTATSEHHGSVVSLRSHKHNQNLTGVNKSLSNAGVASPRGSLSCNPAGSNSSLL